MRKQRASSRLARATGLAAWIVGFLALVIVAGGGLMNLR
jgi:hypothetical protein